MKYTIVEALHNLYDNPKYTVINGKLFSWEDERPKPTEEEIQAKIAELQAAEPLRLLRIQRNRLLAETDWWVLPDRTPTQEQLDYRQALRDITNTYTSLDDVIWPEKPE